MKHHTASTFQPKYLADHSLVKIVNNSTVIMSLNFTCRGAPEAPASPACFDTESADVIVNSFTFKLQDFVSPVKLKILSSCHFES